MSEISSAKCTWKDMVKGNFTPDALKKWIVIGYSIIVSFCLLAFVAYNLNQQARMAAGLEYSPYNILNDTFSYLGSFNDDKNPQGWWLFSIALWVMSIFFVPLIFYMYRRISVIDKIAARFGFLLFILGVIGIFLVGIFPDSNKDFIEDLRYGKIHNLVAIFAFVGLGIGPLWFGFILCRDNFPWVPKLPWTGPSGQKLFNHKKLRWPFILLFCVIGLAVFFLISWEVVWPRDYVPLGIGHWPGVGIYSFPLWEWTLITTLFIVIAWFLLVLPNEIPNSNKQTNSTY